jgi:hypothetical protein
LTPYDERREALRSVVSALLPSPLGPADLTVVPGGEGAMETRRPAAVLVVGRPGSRAQRPADVPHLSHHHHFTLFPAIGAPRALLPQRARSAERAVLLRPRTAASVVQRLAHRAVAAVPSRAVEILGAPICFSSTERSELLLRVSDILPNGRVGFVLSPPSYSRAVLVAFESAGGPALIAKFAADPDSARRLAHEWKALSFLQRVPALARTAPPPTAYIRGHLGDALIAGALQGAPAPLDLIPAVRDWLAACRLDDTVAVDESDVVRRVGRNVRLEGPVRAKLRPLFDLVLGVLRGHRVPVTVVHGDFIPWNVLLDRGGVRVFDWEYAAIRGVPGWDEIFWVLQTGLIRLGWGATELAAAAESIVRHPLAHYSARAHRALVAMVLIDVVARYSDPQDTRYVQAVTGGLQRLFARGWLE